MLRLAIDRLNRLRTAHILPYRDILHLRRNDSLPRIMHLRHICIRLRHPHLFLQIAKRNPLRILSLTIITRLIPTRRNPCRIPTLLNPIFPNPRQSLFQLQLHLRIRRRSTCIIHPNRLILHRLPIYPLRLRQPDLTHRNPHILPTTHHIHLPRIRVIISIVIKRMFWLNHLGSYSLPIS